MKLILLSALQDKLISEDCRVMHFKLPVPNRILVNHVIQSAQVKSEIECETNCFAHDDCMSVNLAPLQDGNYLCELSNSDHDIHPADFKQMDRTLFKPVKVSLVTSQTECLR